MQLLERTFTLLIGAIFGAGVVFLIIAILNLNGATLAPGIAQPASLMLGVTGVILVAAIGIPVFFKKKDNGR